MPTTPTDPLYGTQTHFSLLGDIETIWDELTSSLVARATTNYTVTVTTTIFQAA